MGKGKKQEAGGMGLLPDITRHKGPRCKNICKKHGKMRGPRCSKHLPLRKGPIWNSQNVAELNGCPKNEIQIHGSRRPGYAR